MKFDISKFHFIENYIQLFMANRVSKELCCQSVGGYVCVFFLYYFVFVCVCVFVQVDNDGIVICMPMTESQPLSWYAKLKDLVFHMQVF